jgi:serine/threonine-protein kinase
MTIKLTPESFLTGFRQSGLVHEDRVESIINDLRKSGVDFGSAQSIAAAMIKKKLITEWQADKLLQGRHKGFILGRYRLQALLGKGEMSAVYQARHITMERSCAIKVLPANRVKDTSYLGRFYREARAVAALNHPHIVSAYDVDQQSEGGAEIHFLVMEHVEGANLEELIKQKGKIDIQNAADYIRQGAEGLAHAHQSGLIHRDIKPGNFLINTQGTVKLLDLGLARFFNTDGEESLTIKHDEKVLGTADFLAPEQAIDSHAVDARADIYSLGCTLYYCLTGHPPFTDGTLVQRLLAHQTKTPPSVKLDRPETPESLVTILEKMMAKNKEDRYQTARDTADALGQWLVLNADRNWKMSHVDLVAKFDALETLISPEKLKKLIGHKSSAVIDQISNSGEKTKPPIKREKALAGTSSSRSLPELPALPPAPVKLKEDKASIVAAPILAEPINKSAKSAATITPASGKKSLLTVFEGNEWILPTVVGMTVAVVCLIGFATYQYASQPVAAAGLVPSRSSGQVLIDDAQPQVNKYRPVVHQDIIAEEGLTLPEAPSPVN